jgi:hypothetical protein
MNRHWKIEFLWMEAFNHPAMRDDWYRLAAEFIVAAHLEAKCR